LREIEKEVGEVFKENKHFAAIVIETRLRLNEEVC
jgi:hypothetical protein